MADGGRIGGEWKFHKKPQFLEDRCKVWDELYAKQTEVYAGKLILTHNCGVLT